MRNVLFVGAALLCFVGSMPTSAKASDDTTPKGSRTSPLVPKPTGEPLDICHNPLFIANGKSTNTAQGLFTWRWQDPPDQTVGVFDLENETCVPKIYDLFVANEQELTLAITHSDGAACTAAITYVDNPPRDYGAVISGVLSPVLPKVLNVVGKTAKAESIVLPAAKVKNTVATVTLSCQAPKDDAHEDIVLGVQRKITVHYGTVDLFSGSAGTIISPLGKRIYGIQTTQTGTTNGVATTQAAIAVTSSSRLQFVPIALVNFNYMGNKNFNWNMQFGVGINPNGSSTQVEYFASPIAFSMHNLYLSPGLHIARSERIINGFYVGDVVSSSSFTVPTQWRATYKFGFTVSYKPYK
jgi:hypothetical protein